MLRVLLASCAALPDSDPDDRHLPAVLTELGVQAQWAPWDAPDIDFTGADLVVLRSTWDYTERLAEFRTWCHTVARLANPAAVVEWNTDKSYLLELADDGVPTVPTVLVTPSDDLPDGLDVGADGVVLKPSVGAGSRGAGRFGDLGAARQHLATLHAGGFTALLQPFQPDVAEHGETALVFVGGAFSHAFHKASLLDGWGADTGELDGSGLFRTERTGGVTASPAQRRVAEDVLDAASGRLGVRRTDLLYARVDLVTGVDGAPLLLELELTEPSLGFAQTDTGAALRFASAVRAMAASS